MTCSVFHFSVSCVPTFPGFHIEDRKKASTSSEANQSLQVLSLAFEEAKFLPLAKELLPTKQTVHP